MIDELTKDKLNFGYRECIKYIDKMIDLTEALQATNEQIFLNFLDELNDRSVKY